MIGVAKKSTPQQNFHLGVPMAEAFRTWLKRNGYNPAVVFKAGLKLLEQMPHEERAKYFEQVEAWEADFVERNAPSTEPAADDDLVQRASEAGHRVGRVARKAQNRETPRERRA